MAKLKNLSIIIPHFSKQESLRKVHSELKLQLHPDDEILIIDDHSPDGVPDFDCLCTKVIKPPKQTPHIYRLNTLRNLGLQYATHDPCIILDPDCIPNPHFLDNARKMYDPSVLFGGTIDKQLEDGSYKRDERYDWHKGSKWVDTNEMRGSGMNIWGGCMFMSKERTRLVGWFDEEFNGAWGAEEHEFANRCYHSGMRLRYAAELAVLHLWHPHNREGYEHNKQLWQSKMKTNAEMLNKVTPYKPRVGVMVINFLRNEVIEQCLRSIFRNPTPVKVRLVINGDDSPETQKAAALWKNRWAVDVVNHPRKWPAEVRTESMQWAKDNGLTYLLMIDDDMMAHSMGVYTLEKALDEHPQFHAISGCMTSSRGTPERMLGGPMRDGNFYNYPPAEGVKQSDWVSGGFTMTRVNPLIPYAEGYETGYNDFVWSMTLNKRRLNVAVCGEAKCIHGYLLTPNGMKPHKSSGDYRRVRYDTERHLRMAKKFRDDWGINIGSGGLWKG